MNTLHVHSALCALFIIFALASRFILARRNRQKIRVQKELGGADDTHVYAFDDLTDKMNPEFRCEQDRWIAWVA